MLNFVLYNCLFELTISMIATINYLFLFLFDIKSIKKEMNVNRENDDITKFKKNTIIMFIIGIIILATLTLKEYVLIILLFVIPITSFIKSIKNTHNKNISQPSIDDKYTDVNSAIIFVVFFSASITPIYFSLFSNSSHIAKELLLIFYLCLKIVIFTYLFFTNVFVLISNIRTTLKNKNHNLKPAHNDEDLKLLLYNFNLYHKFNSRIFKIIDKIIFVILCIPMIAINIVLIIFHIIKKNIASYKYNFWKYIEKSENQKNVITLNATNISIIFSLVIVYIITVLNSSLFSQQITSIYNFISTVILIPCIYDSIKKTKDK